MLASKSSLTGALALFLSLTMACAAPTAPVYTSEFIALGCPNTTSAIATETQQLDAIKDFANTLYINKKPQIAFNKYVATDLINHAAEVPGDGAALALATVGPLIGASTITLEQIFVGQDRAVTFFKGATPIGSVAAIDMFRMSGTCLIEHWVLQEPVTNTTNPHPYF
ncbi:hypothetical protein MMC19_006953 [Ptychographa xylographoides]|nr:hypothetical protein [Ptychographa xylographoides]